MADKSSVQASQETCKNDSIERSSTPKDPKGKAPEKGRQKVKTSVKISESENVLLDAIAKIQV